MLYLGGQTRFYLYKTKPIPSESYQILKNYAFEIATNSETQLEGDIVVTKKFTENFLSINVDTSRYGVEAIFPIYNYNYNIENGIMNYVGTIDYNNVTYFEHTESLSSDFTLDALLVSMLFAAFIYFVCYTIPNAIIEFRKQSNSLCDS